MTVVRSEANIGDEIVEENDMNLLNRKNFEITFDLRGVPTDIPIKQCVRVVGLAGYPHLAAPARPLSGEGIIKIQQSLVIGIDPLMVQRRNHGNGVTQHDNDARGRVESIDVACRGL